ncbi:MAG: N-6 DNA methylase [Methanobrevibacter sp.]|uniref:N-6 DNA methylase n=1 Tax=Methanobrevibacter sp. TaxID=66852 RepID=UPI003F10C0A7
MDNQKQLRVLLRFISKYFNNLYLENAFVYYILFYKFLSDNLVYYSKSILPEGLELEEGLKNKNCHMRLLNELKYFIEPEYLFDNICYRNNSASNVLNELIRGFKQVQRTAHKYGNEFAEEFDILFENLGDIFENKQTEYILPLMGEIALFNFADTTLDYSQLFERIIKWDSNNTNRATGDIISNNILSELFSGLIYSSNLNVRNIYDGFLGSGSLLFNVSNNLGVPEIYGQERQKEVYMIALMNMVVQKYSGKHQILLGDTLSDSKFKNNKFDVIISDIPSIKEKLSFSAAGNLKANYNFNFSFNVRSSEWVHIMSLFSNLGKNGMLMVVISTNSLSSSLKSDNDIRQYLVSENYLDCIINLPPGVLSSSRVPLSILILKKGRSNQDVLFVDATNDFKLHTRKKSPTIDIDDIVEVYSKRKIIPKLSNRVLTEIYDNHFNLSLSRYVDTFDEEFVSLVDAYNRLYELDEYLMKVDEELQNKLEDVIMTKEIKIPKVFLSYARTNLEYAESIVEFASTLRGDGIDASVDEWDLKPGNDIYHFMESKIKSEADFVLLMINDEFTEKANNRTAGVGAETQMIAKELYENVEQGRIIPILWRHDDGEVKLPTIVESRYYIDLSSDDKFGENYELLLRTLFNKPKNPKTEVGKMPEWINDTTNHFTKTKTIIKRFDSQVEAHPEKFNYLIEDFFNEYFEYLKTFNVDFIGKDNASASKEIYESIEEYTALKNDLVVFLEKMFKVARYNKIDSELIIEFLSNIRSLLSGSEQFGLANFDFMLREIFLYFVAYALKYKNYEFIADLFYSPYYFEDYAYTSNDTKYFVDLDVRGRIHTDDILGISFKADNGNSFITPLGELLVRRVPPRLKRELLVDADLLCCYVSYMNKDKFGRKEWFPFTHLYKQKESIDYFTKLNSKKYFNKIKEVFDVDSADEFKEKVALTHDTLLGRRQVRFSNAWGDCVEPIEEYIDLSKLCSER